jgi:hypothetical protein
MLLLATAKNVLGYILGDFFTNSSGHPRSEPGSSADNENAMATVTVATSGRCLRANQHLKSKYL